ncbi:hypothetical protein BC628DRAFT_485463 [Trametes gibbosa]|nr:hypothetical protein BC628DRAFT_485463 [Trametes gibbosa]
MCSPLQVLMLQGVPKTPLLSRMFWSVLLQLALPRLAHGHSHARLLQHIGTVDATSTASHTIHGVTNCYITRNTSTSVVSRTPSSKDPCCLKTFECTHKR